MISQLAPDLWSITEPLRVNGMELGNRMVVIRLPDGSLVLHSPGAWRAEIKDFLEATGKPAFIVAPNLHHTLFLEDYLVRFPGARFLAPPGFDARAKPTRASEVLGTAAVGEWEGVLDHFILEGIPRFNEAVFLHRPSATLIVADLLFNIRRAPTLHVLFWKLNGAYGRLSCSRLFRSTIRDKKAFTRSLEKILQWDFRRILVAHGEVYEGPGPRAFREACAGLLP